MILHLPFWAETGGPERKREIGFSSLQQLEVLKKYSLALMKKSMKSSFKNVFPHKSSTVQDAEVSS